MTELRERIARIVRNGKNQETFSLQVADAILREIEAPSVSLGLLKAKVRGEIERLRTPRYGDGMGGARIARREALEWVLREIEALPPVGADTPLDENGWPKAVGEAAVAHAYLTGCGVPWKDLSLMGRLETFRAMIAAAPEHPVLPVGDEVIERVARLAKIEWPSWVDNEDTIQLVYEHPRQRDSDWRAEVMFGDLRSCLSTLTKAEEPGQ